ncbi:hypothetical protein [Lentzea terrae]|uniref:hypothetical protein n=1 Tax=Lentzea terrae TaxID=2200761 RepID=UPI000DD41712|nr:hypothetical protein [Lentzea terrae]
MSTRTRMVVVVAVIAATVVLSASVIAGLRGTGDPAAPAGPAGPEVAGGPAEHTDPDYWTEERMRDAKPAPMPEPPAGG